MSAELTKSAFKKNFEDIISKYGPVYVINLLRYLKVGKELNLTTEYVRQIQESGDLNDKIKYLNFDFHGMCGGDKYHNLKVLASKIQEQILDYGWFECSTNSKNPML